MAAAAYLSKTRVLAEAPARRAVLGLLLFVIIYTVFMTIPPKSSEKYYVPVYAVLDLIAGISWYTAFDWAKKFAPARRRTLVLISALAVLIMLQAVLALRTFPYYVTYFNPLLGGNRRADQSLMLGSGEGLDLAAEYLNEKPNAKGLKVMSWYGVGPFSYCAAHRECISRHLYSPVMISYKIPVCLPRPCKWNPASLAFRKM